jgi:hypothetical protein
MLLTCKKKCAEFVERKESVEHVFHVKLSHYRPLGLQEVEAARISRQSVHEGGKVVSPTHWRPLPPSGYPWYSFLLEAESTIGP